MKKLFLLIMVMIFLAACSTTQTAEKPSGFLCDYYNNLEPGGEGEAKLLWIKPGVDFTKYKKVMVDYVIFPLPKTRNTKASMRMI